MCLFPPPCKAPDNSVLRGSLHQHGPGHCDKFQWVDCTILEFALFKIPPLNTQIGIWCQFFLSLEHFQTTFLYLGNFLKGLLTNRQQNFHCNYYSVSEFIFPASIYLISLYFQTKFEVNILFSTPAVPNPFGTRDWFCGRQFFNRRQEGWFQADLSAFHLLYHCCSVAKSYLTFCYPINCSLPGSSVHGIC